MPPPETASEAISEANDHAQAPDADQTGVKEGGGKTPLRKTHPFRHVISTAVKDTPGKDTPAKHTRAKYTPSKNTHAKDTPAKDTPLQPCHIYPCGERRVRKPKACSQTTHHWQSAHERQHCQKVRQGNATRNRWRSFGRYCHNGRNSRLKYGRSLRMKSLSAFMLGFLTCTAHKELVSSFVLQVALFCFD